MKHNATIFLANALFTVGAIALFLGFNAAQADDTTSLTVAASLPGEFTYQGYLEYNGSPLNSLCDVRFRYYPDATSVIQIGIAQTVENVVFDDGLFTAAFNAGTLFEDGVTHIEVAISCDNAQFVPLVPRLSVTGAPYAHTLRPGATVKSNGQDTLNLVNTGGNAGLAVDTDSGGHNGIEVEAEWDGLVINSAGDDGIQIAGAADDAIAIDEPGGIGVKVFKANEHGISASTQSASHYAAQIFNESGSGNGRGLFARGGSGDAIDLVLGANDGGNVGDNGILSTDPDQPSSDLFIYSNDAIVMQLDRDGDGEDADFRIEDKDGNILFNIDESGEIMADYGGSLDFATPFAIARIDFTAEIEYATANVVAVVENPSFGIYTVVIDVGCNDYYFVPIATSVFASRVVSADVDCTSENQLAIEVDVDNLQPGVDRTRFNLVVYRLVR